ncbi:MAG: diversity-generating retroelement protein Avd [Chloroflexota bacterium]
MEESPIFAKTYDLLVWLVPATQKFPKEERFVLAKHIQEKAFEFQDEIIAAGLGVEKARHLQEADVRLRQLQVYIRMSVHFKFLTLRQYEHVSNMTVEIGKILGGWRKKAGV